MALLLLSDIVKVGCDDYPRVVHPIEPFVYLIDFDFLVYCMQGQEMDLLHSLRGFDRSMTRSAISAFQ